MFPEPTPKKTVEAEPAVDDSSTDSEASESEDSEDSVDTVDDEAVDSEGDSYGESEGDEPKEKSSTDLSYADLRSADLDSILGISSEGRTVEAVPGLSEILSIYGKSVSDKASE
jgi:hypothetical protein